MRDMNRSHVSQTKLMRTDHQTAAHNRWLAAELQDALDDPRPSLSFEVGMAAIDAEIDAVERESAIDPAQAEQPFLSRALRRR